MHLSLIQKQIWEKKAAGRTYNEILNNFPFVKHNHSISTCLRRTALGLFWDINNKGGNDPYLCIEDENKLIEFIRDHSFANNCVRTFEVLDAALSLQISRNIWARKQLLSIGCLNLMEEIDQSPNEPSRSWVNDFCIKNGFSIKSAIEIDRNRYIAGYKEELIQFLMKISYEVIDSTPELIFNADETMLSGKRLYKAITENNRAITRESFSFQHMTAMITLNAAGEQVPLFIILSGLLHFPKSLEEFKHKYWFSSSANGWMTKYLFLAWSINLCHWISFHRKKLPKEKAGKKAILFLDGHSSRLCPAAIDYFQRHNVTVIILPSHTTHILQPFDICISSPLKTCFKKMLVRWKNLIFDECNSESDRLRKITIISIIEAFSKTVTPFSSMQSFRKAGFYPLSFNALNSPYVINGENPSFQNRNSSYTLSQKIFHGHEELIELYNSLTNHRSRQDITMNLVDPIMLQVKMMNMNLSNGLLFSNFYPLVIENNEGIAFIQKFS